MNLYLQADIKKYFLPSKPLFDQVMALNGEVFRSQKGRVTQRITLGDKTYFIKQHHGVGWKEIIKNILFGRAPVLGARNEWLALEKLSALGVRVPHIAGFGERGCNPATRQSFVLMEDVTPSISLEDVCRHWRVTAPDVSFKRELIKRVATIARTLHQNGINHRDLYICHFLLPAKAGILCLIDLHRAQIRHKVPERWIIKDLAGLYFSSKDIGLSARDYYRFMKQYSHKPLRDIFKTELHFWEKVKERGNKLYRDHQ